MASPQGNGSCVGTTVAAVGTVVQEPRSLLTWAKVPESPQLAEEASGGCSGFLRLKDQA